MGAKSNLPHSHAVAGIFFIGIAKGHNLQALPATGSSGVHKLTIDSAPKGAEMMPSKVLEVLGLLDFHSNFI